MHNIFSRRTVSTAEPLPAVLLTDLEQLYGAIAPIRTFDLAAASNARLPHGSRRFPALRSLAIGSAVVAVAGLAALIAAPSFHGPGPESVSAAEILQKASEAASRLSRGETSYFMARNSVVPNAGGAPELQTSLLWSRDAEHWRLEIYATDPATVQPTGQILVAYARNGNDFWIFYPQEGNVVSVGHETAERFAFARIDWGPKADLDAALAEYAPRCLGEAKVAGTEDVAGRSAYRIEFSSDPDVCPNTSSMWIDRKTFLPLKHETSGKATLSSTVTKLQFGPIDNERFDYHPPSGTVVNYQDRGEIVVIP